MAKKGLKQKQKGLKTKAKLNKLEKVAKDKTFGMKNKKKSKKV